MELSTPKLLADEMKNLSSSMTKLMDTGKSMFIQICQKLCKVTQELTERQEKLIDIASTLSSSENVPPESFKGLSDLNIEFRTEEEFSELIQDHFSKDQKSKLDFSLFSEDITKILNHLQESNEFIQILKENCDNEKLERGKIIQKIDQVEKSSQESEKKIQIKIKEQEEFFKKKKNKLARKKNTDALNKRISLIEKSLLSQDFFIQEVTRKYDSIIDGTNQKDLILKIQEKNYKDFTKSIDERLSKNLDRISEKLDKQGVEMKKFQENLRNQVEEYHTQRDINQREEFSELANEQSAGFERFRKEINEKVESLTAQYREIVESFDQELTNRMKLEVKTVVEIKKEEEVQERLQTRKSEFS